MTVAVYSIAPLLHEKRTLVGQVDGATSEEVRDRLEKLGALTIVSEDKLYVTILGYDHNLVELISKFRLAEYVPAKTKRYMRRS